MLGINSTGRVEGLVYFDANGSREPDEGDPAQAGVRVRLVVAGTPDTVARATSGADGTFVMPGVPVGNYELVVDTFSLPDSFEVVRIDTTAIALTPDDTTLASVALGFPIVTVPEARALPAGTRIFVQGVTLNSLGTFGDLTLHIADTTAAIRATRVSPSAIFAGDLVRLRGTTRVDDGQPTLDDVAPFLVSILAVPPPKLLSSGVAAAADSARLDANLVEVAGATLSDTATVDGDFVLTVNDGSGDLAVVLDRDVGFDLTPFIPGVDLDAIGLLVPDGSGAWNLKPRSGSDLTIN